MVFGLLQFKTGLSANILQLWIGKFIKMHLSFKMSPRTLIYVNNWCIYKINLVHLLFSTVFYIFKHNFVIFGPINMFFFFFFKNPVYCLSRWSLMLDFTYWYATPLAPSASFAPSFPSLPQLLHEAHPEWSLPMQIQHRNTVFGSTMWEVCASVA